MAATTTDRPIWGACMFSIDFSKIHQWIIDIQTPLLTLYVYSHEATVEDTHSLESVQESEPLMIQHASVDCADHMQSTGFTLVLSESMSTAASEGPASLTHDEMRQPNPQGLN
ncbi:hypothetical protein DPMN_194871 [Dreissena polymorpha]|uniref:Uncharacterized protein n=1 Tax=Dreissena polymorpha TaxID=45954 RepID=A0A9D3XXY6_DREPO|nr:hypothetical protein DPMN_194871 [Dreissena polymorpha]